MSIELEPKPEKPQPTGQPTLLNYYARAAVSEARRFRQGLTRENITTFLKTMAWTIPLTLLIWVYAERQQEVTDSSIPITIEVRSTDRYKVVSLLPTDRVIMCDLTGPRSNLDRFRNSLSPSKPIIVDVDTHDLPNQDNYISTLESVRNNSRFKDAGVTVDKCAPAFLTVAVDAMMTKSLPIKAPDLPTLQSAEFNPKTTTVTGPRHLLDEKGYVEADLSALPFLNQPGPQPPQKVALIPDSSGLLTYSPTEVEATVVVKEQDAKAEIHNIPIWVSGPASLQDVTITPSTDTLPTLKLIGPPEEIDKISINGPVQPRAELYVSKDNLHSGANAVPLSIHFFRDSVEYVPPGVRIDGPPPEITFTATQRNP